MSTAIGDLVVSLSVENQNFLAQLNKSGASLDEFAMHTHAGSGAIAELGEHSEEAGGHVGGAARAFVFLGNQIKEAGEGLGEQNAMLGQTITSLGGTVSGLGEAVHGYHALHTAIEFASGAQVFLNSISPLGWTALATGALAAAAAYVEFGGASKEAEEAEKKRQDAAKATDDALEHLRRQVEGLDNSPLNQLHEQLRQAKEELGLSSLMAGRWATFPW